MKTKHNKKRNTALVYEALIREGTSAILQKDHVRRNTVVSIIKKHFKPDSILHKDLQCYRSLYENQGIPSTECQKIIREARLQKKRINPQMLFKEQSDLIRDINKHVESSLFNNFVPNYKSLANIYQLFADTSSPKEIVLLEQVVSVAMATAPATEEKEQIDNIVVEKFVLKFNEKYDSDLLPEQKELLNLYIKSFVDNSVEFKTFLNEEIKRLKDGILAAQALESFVEDKEMGNKIQKVWERLEEFKKTEICDDVILTILRTQSLIEETTQDGDSN